MNRLAVPIGRLASRKRAVMMIGAMTDPHLHSVQKRRVHTGKSDLLGSRGGERFVLRPGRDRSYRHTTADDSARDEAVVDLGA
jgi:hypothetical protein